MSGRKRRRPRLPDGEVEGRVRGGCCCFAFECLAILVVFSEVPAGQLPPAQSYSTSTSDSREGIAQQVLSGRDRRNLEWIKGLPELTVRRTLGGTRAGALLALESVREEMYAFDVDNAPSPGESEFGFRSPIGLHVVQAEWIPQNRADLQRSKFYEEWLSAMRLELEGHNEIGTFLVDVVPKAVNVITAK